MKVKIAYLNLLITLIVLIVIVVVIVLLYEKWIKLVKKFKRVKNKLFKVVPTINHPEYSKLKYDLIKDKLSSSDSFNISVAKTLISTIMSTYNTYSNLDPRLPSYINLITKIGSNCVLYSMNNGVYIYSFRGTVTSGDVWTDFNFIQCPFKGNKSYKDNILVHRGFYDLWLLHNKSLLSSLNDIKNATCIYITGHSLGAALAAFTALEYSNNTTIPLYLYLFAPPRIGNNGFINSLYEKVQNSWAHINATDVVCELPPTTCPTFTSTYYYDDYRKIYRSDYQTGSIIGNHHLQTYLDVLDNKSIIEDNTTWNRNSVIITI